MNSKSTLKSLHSAVESLGIYLLILLTPVYLCSLSYNLQVREVTFSSLVPGKNYSVDVRAAKQKKLSPRISAEFLTCKSPVPYT